VQKGRAGIDGFAGDIAAQRRHVAARVPSYDRVLALVADQLSGDIGRRLGKAWARRRFDEMHHRPLLLLATLRYDALVTGPEHPLWLALAADDPDPSAVTPAALERVLGRPPRGPRTQGSRVAAGENSRGDRPRIWHSLTRRCVQTNEVSRAVAWLWPAHLAGAGRELVLCDMGCSAGLNLVADSLGLGWTERSLQDPGWSRPLPVAHRPRVTRRLGFDLEPLDARDEEDSTWLRACIWAGERQRLDRFDRALAAFRAAAAGPAAPSIETIDARDMPARLIELGAGQDGGALWLAYQSIVREYLGAARRPYEDGMRRWLRSRPPGSAMWIELENPPHGATRTWPTALNAHVVRPGGDLLEVVLARCAYHPVDVAPEPDAVAAVRDALAARAA
jgi:hypothetical protein